jgi:hypothetical protein
MGKGSVSIAKNFACSQGKYFDRIKLRTGDKVDSAELWCKGGIGSGRIGGDGGSDKDMWCDGFNKIEYNAGAYIDSMNLICANGNQTGWVGGKGGSPKTPIKCDPGKVFTSLSMDIRDGNLAGEFRASCDYKIDCHNKENLFRDECKELKRNDNTRYQQLMNEYCNENDTNAKSDNCRAWCVGGSITSCVRLNTLNDCTKYKISDSECNIQKVGEVKALCQSHNIEQELGTRAGWACSEESVKLFKEECNTYNIPMEVCDPMLLADTKANEINKQLAKQSIDVSQEQFEYTQNALTSVLRMSNYTPPPTIKPTTKPVTKPEESEDTMIIVIVILLLSIGVGMYLIM